jgi:TOBE domain-containing protein
MRYVFDDLGYQRLAWRCTTTNVASLTLAPKSLDEEAQDRRLARSWRTGNELQTKGEGSHAGHVGQIADAAFAGGLWRYRLLLGTGDSLMVTQSNLGSAPFKVGDAVAAAFAPADAWVIATAESNGRRMP